MAQYRDALPQLDGDLFLTDGGIETTLIFHEKMDLPDFSAFYLFGTPAGIRVLDKYYRSYADIAKRFHTGLILESATWRASSDWGIKLGYDVQALANANHAAIGLLERIRYDYQTKDFPIVISGCIGPRGDGYVPERMMSSAGAQIYHQKQADTFAETAADMLSAITMNYAEEAVGVTRAARRAHMPVSISFTVETDGVLPTGQTLASAIEQVDDETDGYPSYYMINCAHPTHFTTGLRAGASWMGRIRGIRANASRQSHAELNDATELDPGDPDELGLQYAQLKRRHRHLNVMGGCCGTDQRHIQQIAVACGPFFRDMN